MTDLPVYFLAAAVAFVGVVMAITAAAIVSLFNAVTAKGQDNQAQLAARDAAIADLTAQLAAAQANAITPEVEAAAVATASAFNIVIDGMGGVSAPAAPVAPE